MPDRSLELIQNPKDVAAIAKTLSQASMIAFDTEFIRESTFYPKLEILQIATPGDAWLIDCQALSKSEMKPILDVFQDPKILKIVHAAHGDQECLLSAYDILSDLPKGYARTNWSKRPLPKPVLEYALLDVKHLIEVAAILFERLDKNGRRDWAMELSAKFSDRKLYEVPAEDIARRLAQSGKFHVRDYAVLLELVRWREDRVRELDVPRRWLAEDGVLIDLAKIKPITVEQLQGFRGLSRGEAKLPQAKRILQAIETGIKCKDEIPKDLKQRNTLQPTSEESLGIDLLRVLLSLLSDQYSIASKHIVQPQSQLPLLRLQPASLSDLKESGLVSPQLGDSGMQKLYSFLRGELSLTLESGKRVKLRE